MEDRQKIQRLFVYGTLAPGRANHEVLRDIPGTWRQASLRGRLYDEGWGAGMGCPGIVPDSNGESVEGYLLASEQLEAHWPRLDAFEGEGYRRRLVAVTIDGASEVEAWVYALQREGQADG